jgi:hypothetical protein
MDHLTPDGVSKIWLLIWVVKSQEVTPNIVAFYAFMKCIVNLRIL